MSSVWCDPTHALNRASFWLERLKRAEAAAGPSRLELKQEDWVVALLTALAREAGFDHLDVREVHGDTLWYGYVLAELTGLPVATARGLYLDGIMLGIALAGGLEADDPNE